MKQITVENFKELRRNQTLLKGTSDPTEIFLHVKHSRWGPAITVRSLSTGVLHSKLIGGALRNEKLYLIETEADVLSDLKEFI